jgi:hypothetical protein
MKLLLKSKTLSISINCEPGKIYKFVSNLENLSKWAKTFCRSVKKSDGKWVIETPQGDVGIRLVEKNELGILDHYISPSAGVELLVPMRVVPNGSGSEVIFTVFQQSDMSNENFKKDIALVEKDLKSLKRSMENKF